MILPNLQQLGGEKVQYFCHWLVGIKIIPEFLAISNRAKSVGDYQVQKRAVFDIRVNIYGGIYKRAEKRAHQY